MRADVNDIIEGYETKLSVRLSVTELSPQVKAWSRTVFIGVGLASLSAFCESTGVRLTLSGGENV